MDMGGMRQPRDIGVATQRAAHELAAELALEILVRGEPALEAVAVLAPQVKNDHGISRLLYAGHCAPPAWLGQQTTGFDSSDYPKCNHATNTDIPHPGYACVAKPHLLWLHRESEYWATF